MSSLRLQEDRLRQRRAMLLAECDAQRLRMLRHGRELQGLFHLLDVGARAVRFSRRHPVLVFGTAAAVMAVVKPRRVAEGFRALMAGLRTASVVGPVLSVLRERGAA